MASTLLSRVRRVHRELENNGQIVRERQPGGGSVAFIDGRSTQIANHDASLG